MIDYPRLIKNKCVNIKAITPIKSFDASFYMCINLTMKAKINKGEKMKTALEIGKVRDLYKIVDDLVELRNNANTEFFNDDKFNFILSELQFYHSEVDYGKLYTENKLVK